MGADWGNVLWTGLVCGVRTDWGWLDWGLVGLGGVVEVGDGAEMQDWMGGMWTCCRASEDLGRGLPELGGGSMCIVEVSVMFVWRLFGYVCACWHERVCGEERVWGEGREKEKNGGEYSTGACDKVVIRLVRVCVFVCLRQARGLDVFDNVEEGTAKGEDTGAETAGGKGEELRKMIAKRLFVMGKWLERTLRKCECSRRQAARKTREREEIRGE